MKKLFLMALVILLMVNISYADISYSYYPFNYTIFLGEYSGGNITSVLYSDLDNLTIWEINETEEDIQLAVVFDFHNIPAAPPPLDYTSAEYRLFVNGSSKLANGDCGMFAIFNFNDMEFYPFDYPQNLCYNSTGSSFIRNLQVNDPQYYISNGDMRIAMVDMIVENGTRNTISIDLMEMQITFPINITSTTTTPINETYPLGVCPIGNLQSTILFIFFIILSFIIIGMGYAMRNGLIGFIGSLMLLGMGVYMWYCLAFISLLILFLSLVLLSFFIFKGMSGFK